MKLGTKLFLAMGTLALLLVIIGAFSLLQMQNINDNTTEIADNWLPSVIQAEEMNAAVIKYRNQELQHVLATTLKEKESYTRQMKQEEKSFADYAESYRRNLLNPEGRRQFEEVMSLWGQYLKLHESAAELSRQNKMEEALAVLNGENRELYQELTVRVLALVKRNTDGAEAANTEADEAYGQSRSLVIGLLVVAILLAMGLAVLIIRNTLRQLGKDPAELAVLAKDVAGGKLDIDKDAKAVGVYAEILTMVESLKQNIENAQHESARAQEESRKAREAMEQADAASKDAQAKRDGMLRAADRLEEVAGIVSSASTELSAQIEQSDRGASEQASRVTETAAAMNQMNATVVEVARNAGNASEMSTSTRNKAEKGADVVREAVTSIREVQEVSLALKEDMVKLNENARAISQIMAVISDIADQTNLLALNAAIEAARAGDAGRGFAVVADEVRNLAEKTMASTTDVGNAIKAIQDSTAKSMNQVDNAVNRIEQATDLATRSGEALEEIVSMVDATADQVRAIATASEQQSASSEEINRSIAQVNTIASETAQAMQEAAKAVLDLAGQAQVLSTLIEDMKSA